MLFHRFFIWSLASLFFVGCAENKDERPPENEILMDVETQVLDQQVPSDHLAGFEVYTKKCGLCHDRGEAGSPRLGNPKQWVKRVPQGEATLTEHAIEGFEGRWGEMPPQGDDLTPEEVSLAVKYMIYRYEQAE